MGQINYTDDLNYEDNIKYRQDPENKEHSKRMLREIRAGHDHGAGS